MYYKVKFMSAVISIINKSFFCPIKCYVKNTLIHKYIIHNTLIYILCTQNN